MKKLFMWILIILLPFLYSIYAAAQQPQKGVHSSETVSIQEASDSRVK
jgi:hypothetical protein